MDESDEAYHRIDAGGCWVPPNRAAWGPGETLRRLREMCGVSQSELAWRSGVDQADISRVEGGAGAGWRTLARLAEALECDVVFHLRPRRPLDVLVAAGRGSRRRGRSG